MPDDPGELFANLRRSGLSRGQAARRVNRSDAWASDQDVDFSPVELSAAAQRALVDFEFFRIRYMGNISTPWQVEAAERLLELWLTPDKSYVVMSVAPGTGKSTMLHDFAAWITVKDRTIRGLFGSRSGANATRMLRQLRRTLERTQPVVAVDRDRDTGVAVDGAATLAGDYGSFKPEGRDDIWKAEEFAVARPGGRLSARKEPTWSRYGFDGDVLGNRFNFALWDDAVDGKTTNTPEAVEKQRRDWDREIENRLEPGGLIALVGQRISADDLYAYCITKRATLEDDDFDRPKYHHIIYPAHFEEHCTEQHSVSVAQSFPHGCLLDAYRLPWFGGEGLKQIAENTPEVFEVQYQQREGDPNAALIHPLWLKGGTDHNTGNMYPGCRDEHRVLRELPAEFDGQSISVAMVDPSGVKHWAVNWIVGEPNANRHHLMDTFDGKMGANELLDYDPDRGRFTGIMEEWQQASKTAGVPITVWIVEINAAQRYLLQYAHVNRWMKQHNVRIIPHTTTKTKLDPNLGPQIMVEPFRAGRVRLPWGDRAAIAKVGVIEHQLTNYPNKQVRDDQVHSLWFYFAHLHELIPRKHPIPLLSRPSWLNGGKARTLARQ